MTPDSNGILYLEETDPITPFQTTINALQAATSEALDDLSAGIRKSQVFYPDSGFPVALTGVTGESTATNRITIPSAPYARVVSADALVALRYSQSTTIEALLYLDTTVRCRNRQVMVAGQYISFGLAASYQLPANQSMTIEVRFLRQSGTGLVDSASGSLNTLYATAHPA